MILRPAGNDFRTAYGTSVHRNHGPAVLALRFDFLSVEIACQRFAVRRQFDLAAEIPSHSHKELMMWHYIMQFFYSFVTDYDSVGVMEETAPEEITVWIPTGRDQAQILKQMINDDFTPNHDIAANVQLITAAALLPSIFAGSAPDIYSGSLQADPINLSLRDAVVDLSEFPDFKDVIGRYTKEATVPFQRDGATYALPDTMDYYIMFVRTDIMEELGLRLMRGERHVRQEECEFLLLQRRQPLPSQREP